MENLGEFHAKLRLEATSRRIQFPKIKHHGS